jgi:hypothetical protein
MKTIWGETMSKAPTIPGSPSEITPDWLTQALRAGGTIGDDVTVSAVDAEPVGVGVGLVGALARLTPAYAGGAGPASVIAKLPAPDEGTRFVASILRMYRKEVGFYTDLSGRTVLPHAHCYYAAHDDDTDAFVLLLEDLSGGRVVDQLDGCSRPDAEAAIDRLADFHAGFWNDATLAGTGWVNALCDAPFPDAIAMSYDQSWEPVQALFGGHLTPELKGFGDRYTALLPEMVARLSEPPFTLSHGDYRLDNFFFDDAGSSPELKVCDWQLVDRSRGARDLAYFLSQSVTPDARADLEKPLVERYASRLQYHGIDDYPLDVAWDDYRLAVAFSFVYPVVAGGSLDHADERATRLTEEMFRRSARAITELDSLALI